MKKFSGLFICCLVLLFAFRTEAQIKDKDTLVQRIYRAVKNTDETVEKIKANGGSVKVPPFDAPGVGRMSVVADPSGAAFSVIQFAAPA